MERGAASPQGILTKPAPNWEQQGCVSTVLQPGLLIRMQLSAKGALLPGVAAPPDVPAGPSVPYRTYRHL